MIGPMGTLMCPWFPGPAVVVPRWRRCPQTPVLYCRARDHGCRCAEADILRRAHSRKFAYRLLQANSRLPSHNIPSAHHKIHTCTDTGNPKIFSNPQQQSSWHVHVPGVDACEPPPQSNHFLSARSLICASQTCTKDALYSCATHGGHVH